MLSVEEGAEIEDAVVMGGTVIKKGASGQTLYCCRKCRDRRKRGCRDAERRRRQALATIGSGVYIGDGAKVGPAAMIDQKCKGW